MTNQEVYNYIHNEICDHLKNNGNNYVADDYVKAGYGQISGGYFVEAYRQGVEIMMEKAEPSQRWHILTSYYEEKMNNPERYPRFKLDSKANFNLILCPQLMLWIAEIAGLKREILETAKNNAIRYEEKTGSKSCRSIKKDVLNEGLKWREINSAIQNANTWDDVIKSVGNL